MYWRSKIETCVNALDHICEGISRPAVDSVTSHWLGSKGVLITRNMDISAGLHGMFATT